MNPYRQQLVDLVEDLELMLADAKDLLRLIDANERGDPAIADQAIAYIEKRRGGLQ